MNAAELVDRLGLTVHVLGEPERPVTGGYTGDLLSWVMGRAPAEGAWITIMSNVNVAAVALLADVSLILLAEGVTPDPALLDRARREGMNLCSSPLSAYALAWKLHELTGA